MLRAARLLTAGDRHLAEDLVQTTLVRLYSAWPRLREKPIAYAHRVIINAHIDVTRRSWWRRERSVSDLPEPGPLSSGSDDLREVIRAALASLPPRMRAVVVLRYWLDFSVAESADLLGCTEGTVKSQTARAVVKLREHLGSVHSEHFSFDLAPPALQPAAHPLRSF